MVFQTGYVEILYAAMVVGIAVALYFLRHFFERMDKMAGFTADMEEKGKKLAMLALAVVLFVLNRVPGNLW